MATTTTTRRGGMGGVSPPEKKTMRLEAAARIQFRGGLAHFTPFLIVKALKTLRKQAKNL